MAAIISDPTTPQGGASDPPVRSWPDLYLTAAHEARLKRAISQPVAAARNYRTALGKSELEELGFKPYQRRVPGILIPILNTESVIVSYQFRPDNPRKNKHGRIVKYEAIAGSRKVLDVPPTCCAALSDPSVRLWIAEGSIKADCIVSQGGCAVSIQGVYGWRGTNPEGGKVALPDWESIALNGREIIIAFDSDVGWNRNVRTAAERLRNFLASKGANVFFLTWDSAEQE